ncbi:MAG: NAD(P)/FAD-dependent oxidoreductase [Ignisphaera sp.]
MKYDVIVIGAGVAGLFASFTLAKNGFKVAFVDMKSENSIGDKVCGDAVGEHHFVELGLDPPKIYDEATNVYRGVRLVSPDEQHIIDVHGKGYSLNRQKFGYRLFTLAVNAGAEPYLEHYFTTPLIEGSWVKGALVKDRSGNTKVMRANVVIDATGVAATVRSKLPKEWWVSEPIPKEDFNITYREIIEGDIRDLEEDMAYIYINTDIAPGGYWWLFPKGRGIYNIGLGVQWKNNTQNPKYNYDKYIRPRIQRSITRILHSGGGLVPTRRPIPCMVWNGFVVIGDAAATANPVHGGGIGSAMISAYAATKVITKVLSKGEPTMDNLWEYHIEYHKLYGAKQASLDILRMFIQHLSNNDFNFIFKSKLVISDEVYNIGYKGELSVSILNRLKTFVSLVSKPSFLSKLYRLKQYMDQAYSLYLSYPSSPTEYLKWRTKEIEMFSEFKKWIQSI